MAGNEGALAQANEVELLVSENRVLFQGLAGLIRLYRQWRKKRSHLSISNFDALGVSASPLLDLSDLLLQLGLLAVLHDAVEDSGGNRRMLVRTSPRFRDEQVGTVVVEVADEGAFVRGIIVGVFIKC